MTTIIFHEGKLNLFIDKQNLSNSELSEIVGTQVNEVQELTTFDLVALQSVYSYSRYIVN